jgi:acetyl esterase/lipase
MSRTLVIAIAALALGGLGCTSLLDHTAMAFLYEEAALPAEQVRLDIPYRNDLDAHLQKHRLDLFLPGKDAHPDGEPWPVLVFVHGGGWTHGDRALVAGGEDVYRNIGRFFASQGVGTAVISYRLQPEVTWQAQVRDVAQAVAWVHAHIGAYGGDPRAIFVGGHSAGGQLAARVALDPAALEAVAPAGTRVCGVIPVSGAGFDLADEQTYALGADPAYYEARFRNGHMDDTWKLDASLIRFARPDVPPALILYAGGESRALQRQAHVLDDALRAAGATTTLIEVPGEDHRRIILTLSRANRTSAPAMLAFIRDTDCGAGSGAVRRR